MPKQSIQTSITFRDFSAHESAEIIPHFPVFCAWCLREGKETVLRYSIAKGSHGICVEHLKRELG